MKNLTFNTAALAILGFALLASTAQAQTGTPAPAGQEQRVDKRQERQDQRIDQGVASGEITAREKRHLEHQQRRLARLESRTEADGTVTRKEALRVEKAQDHASHSIARNKHDRHDRHDRPRAN